MFYSVELLNFSPGVSLLALKDCSEEVRREPGYIGVFATKTQNIKRLLLKKTRHLKSMNLALSCTWEDVRVWVH